MYLFHVEQWNQALGRKNSGDSHWSRSWEELQSGSQRRLHSDRNKPRDELHVGPEDYRCGSRGSIFPGRCGMDWELRFQMQCCASRTRPPLWKAGLGKAFEQEAASRPCLVICVIVQSVWNTPEYLELEVKPSSLQDWRIHRVILSLESSFSKPILLAV